MGFNIDNQYKNNNEKRDNLLISAFVKYCILKLGIKGDFNITLLPKINDSKITTGAYDRGSNIFARYEGRAIVDVLRTICHEMVHMKQMERGDFKLDTEVQDVGGKIEDEANAMAGELIKSFKNDYKCEWIYSL